MKISWARSATKHRVSRERSRYVIEHAGLAFEVQRPIESGRQRLLYVGEDQEGAPLEVIAIEFDSGDLHVIHAMALRDRYRSQYEEAKKWRV